MLVGHGDDDDDETGISHFENERARADESASFYRLWPHLSAV